MIKYFEYENSGANSFSVNATKFDVKGLESNGARNLFTLLINDLLPDTKYMI